MSSGDLQQLQKLFAQLMEMTAPQKREELARLERNHPEMARELEHLMGHAHEAEGFFEKGPPSDFPEILRRAHEKSPTGGPRPEILDPTGAEAEAIEESAEVSSEQAETLTWGTFPSSQHLIDPKPLLPKKIGPYKILDCLGEGGMGMVYLAQQDHPVKRKVALKLIKEKRNIKDILARFQSEHQALALMNQANIAHIYNAGVTHKGLPFFTMEYIEGQDIIAFCNHQRLNLRERLALFLQVCEGVLHAHQKGIIHRDLKPSNILIAIQNEKPVPKVIDFGIAKAIGEPLSENPAQTRYGSFIGTPAYMSPEQVNSGLETVDTRSDIYSLGAILYELITGYPIIDPDRFMNVTAEKKLQIIREEDPPKPSVTVEKRAAVGADENNSFRISTRDRVRHLRGDLDLIAMKTLHKDPSQRYSSVSGLRGDIWNHLNNEPVSAASPGKLYRLRKFFRRNKVYAFASLLVLASLVIGLSLALVQRYQAIVARDRAESVLNFLQGILESPHPNQQGKDVRLLDALNNAEDLLQSKLQGQPETQALVLVTIGKSYYGLGSYRQAQKQADKALQLEKFAAIPAVEKVKVFDLLGRSLGEQGMLEGAEKAFQRALQAAPPDHPQKFKALSGLGTIYLYGGKNQKAQETYQSAYELQKAALGEEHRDSLVSLVGLANAHISLNQYQHAEGLLRQALAIQKKKLGDTHSQTVTTMHILADCLLGQGNYQTAEAEFGRILQIRKERLGLKHPQTLLSLKGLGQAYFEQNQWEKAESVWREALTYSQDILGPHHMETLSLKNNLALTLEHQGKYAKALEMLNEVVKSFQQNEQGNHPTALLSQNNIASYLIQLGRGLEAIPILQQTIRIHEKEYGEDKARALFFKATLAEAYQASGQLLKAERVFRSVHQQARLTAGVNPPFKALYQAMLGNCLTTMGRYEEAKALLKKSSLELQGSQTRIRETVKDFIENLIEAWDQPKLRQEFREML